MTTITFPQDWWTRHTSSDLLYSLWLDFDTKKALDATWAALVKEHEVGESGAVPVGGAVIERSGDAQVLLISGGEDALDSLDYAIEDLEEAVQQAGVELPTLTGHSRTLERD